jgi:hypothetical protein
LNLNLDNVNTFVWSQAIYATFTANATALIVEDLTDRTSPAALTVRATLTAKAASVNQIGYVALNANEADTLTYELVRDRGTILLANAPFGGTPAYTKMYRIYVEDNPNPLVRSAALEALGRHGEPEDAELVAKQLKDKSVQVRLAAAKALQRLHNPKVTAIMCSRLIDEGEDSGVRIELAVALGQYASDDVFQALAATLDARAFTRGGTTRRSITDHTGREGTAEGPSRWCYTRSPKPRPRDPKGEGGGETPHPPHPPEGAAGHGQDQGREGSKQRRTKRKRAKHRCEHAQNSRGQHPFLQKTAERWRGGSRPLPRSGRPSAPEKGGRCGLGDAG